MKKSYTLLAIPAILLSACGGGGGGGSSSEGNKIIFWNTFGHTAQSAIEKLAEDFTEIIKEEEGVDVEISLEYQGSYDDILDKITRGFSANNTPTMAIAYPDHVANYLSLNPQYVYNLEDYMNDSEIGFGKESILGDRSGEYANDFVSAFAEEGTKYAVEGTYSLPFMKSTEVMFYNVDAVTRGMASYDVPTEYVGNPQGFIDSLDWEGLLAFGEHCLENKSQVMSTMEHAIWYDSDANLFVSKMFQQEIGYSSIVDGKGQIDFESGENRTKAEAFVTSLKEAHDAGIFTTKDCEGGTYGSDAFKKGEVVFEIGSSGGAGYNDPSGGSFEVGVARVPASDGADGESNPLYITQGPTLTFLRSPGLSDEVNNQRMRWAWRFAKFITNPENNVYMCIIGSEGYIPVRESAYETSNYTQYLSEGDTLPVKSANVVISKINGTYFNAPVFKGSAQLRELCGGIITNALTGNKTVSTAFDDAIATAKTNF